MSHEKLDQQILSKFREHSDLYKRTRKVKVAVNRATAEAGQPFLENGKLIVPAGEKLVGLFKPEFETLQLEQPVTTPQSRRFSLAASTGSESTSFLANCRVACRLRSETKPLIGIASQPEDDDGATPYEYSWKQNSRALVVSAELAVEPDSKINEFAVEIRMMSGPLAAGCSPIKGRPGTNESVMLSGKRPPEGNKEQQKAEKYLLTSLDPIYQEGRFGYTQGHKFIETETEVHIAAFVVPCTSELSAADLLSEADLLKVVSVKKLEQNVYVIEKDSEERARSGQMVALLDIEDPVQRERTEQWRQVIDLWSTPDAEWCMYRYAKYLCPDRPEDLVSQTVIKLLNTFPKSGELTRSYVIAALRNVHLNRLRDEIPDSQVLTFTDISTDDAAFDPIDNKTLDPKLYSSEFLKAFWDFVQQHDIKAIKIVEFRLLGHSCIEIAEKLGIKISDVKSRWNKILRDAREHLTKRFPTEFVD